MMGCFLPCFGASKRRKHLRSVNATLTGGDQNHVSAKGALEPTNQLTQQKTVEEPIDCNTESKIKIEEQSNNSGETTSTKELIKNLEGSREEQEKAAKEAEDRPHEQYENINFGKGDFDDDFDGEKKDKEDEVNKGLLQEESSESLFSLSIDSRKQVSAAEKSEIEVNSSMRFTGVLCTRKEESEAFGSSPSAGERVQHVSSVLNPLENLAQGKPSKATGVQSSKKAKENSNEESSAKELVKKLEENNEEQGKARAWNNHLDYRYQDCCDEGYEDINLDESDFDVTFADDDPHNEKRGEGEEGGDVNRTWVQEESSESLFSLSTDSRKRISAPEKAENEVNSLMPVHVTVRITEEETEALASSQSTGGRISDVSSVLNPIENLTQGKVVKATAMQPLKNEKENINFVENVDVDIPFSPEPSLKVSNRKARQKFNDNKQETGVDTSLSSWLVEPETTPISMNSNNSVGGRGSPLSHEDRPILGALTIEEIRKFSVSTSSRRSRSRSPDETPIIGTVGSYWSHTGQTMDSDLSKSGKDAKLKWNSTTLKTRLERAFEASVAEV